MNKNNVKYAEVDEIPEMLFVNQDNLFKNKNLRTDELLQAEGFLIMPLDLNEMKRLILDQINNIVLVSKNESEVDGYTIASNLNQSNPEWSSSVHFLEDIKDTLLASKVLYHKQIARKKTAKGVGKILLERLIDEAKSKNYNFIICHIVLKPVENTLSKQFHESFGFKLIGYEMVEQNETGVYLKQL